MECTLHPACRNDFTSPVDRLFYVHLPNGFAVQSDQEMRPVSPWIKCEHRIRPCSCLS